MAKSIKILGWRYSVSVGHSPSGTDTIFIYRSKPGAGKAPRGRGKGR